VFVCFYLICFDLIQYNDCGICMVILSTIPVIMMEESFAGNSLSREGEGGGGERESE
jgi:hypothetical protein